jgi:hypothetical protein
MGILDNLRHKPERSPPQGGAHKDRIRQAPGDNPSEPGRELNIDGVNDGGTGGGSAPLPKRA